MTRQEALNWCEGQINKQLNYDGMYGNQCTDFINYYYEHVTGQNPYSKGYAVPSAYQYFNVDCDNVTPIRNNINDLNQLPQPGDVMVWKSGLAGTYGNGHVAVVVAADANTMTVIEQNWGGDRVLKHTRGWTGQELGWLSFRQFDAPAPAPAPAPQVVVEEVIKEVYVDKPVYTHDEETKENISWIRKLLERIFK